MTTEAGATAHECPICRDVHLPPTSPQEETLGDDPPGHRIGSMMLPGWDAPLRWCRSCGVWRSGRWGSRHRVAAIIEEETP